MNCQMHLLARSQFIVFCVLLFFTSTFIIYPQQTVAAQDPLSLSMLQHIQELAKKNEESVVLIKMDYSIEADWSNCTIELPEGQIHKHSKKVWAQNGIKQYSDTENYNTEGKMMDSLLSVIDGEVMMSGYKPDFMVGSIDRIENFFWPEVDTVRYGLRPFEGEHTLSEILTSEYASVHNKSEEVDGQDTCVVDIKRPTGATYYGRMWMDKQRGIPLRIEYYDTSPTSSQATLMSRQEIHKLHQLSNGGWFPVEGKTVVFFGDQGTLTSRIIVNTESITIRPEDIPDSLFNITFPKEARVYNAILDMTIGPGGEDK